MDGDIRAILLRIKDKLRVVESGPVAQPVLEEIEADFQKLMELLKLFLISERDSYYGFILMNIVNTANPEPAIGRGTDSAIYMAAGEELLLAERKKMDARGGCSIKGNVQRRETN